MDNADFSPANAPPAVERSWFSVIAGLVGYAAVRLLKAIAGMFILGVTLGVVCAAIVGEGWAMRLAMGLGALAICLIVGVPLGIHRMITGTSAEAVRRTRLASRIVGGALDQVIARFGGHVSGAINRVPLSEIEQGLQQRVSNWFGAPAEAKGLRAALSRRISARIDSAIRRITLAEYRRAEHPDGQVDLVRLRDDLAGRADSLVAHHLTRTSSRITWVAIGSTSVLLLLTAVSIRLLW
jgi:hypothetical protein